MLKFYNKLTFNLHKMKVTFSKTDESIFIFTSFHLMPKNVREFPTMITLNKVPEKGMYFVHTHTHTHTHIYIYIYIYIYTHTYIHTHTRESQMKTLKV